jgi:23S rRNA U2552 (ribose-2'-O)-methylase RlmE/FtsJ
MYNSKIKDNLIYKFNSYSNQTSSNKKILYKENLNLNEKLNNAKNRINAYYENNCALWDKFKKFSNEYEFVYTSSSMNDYKNISNIYPISRSYFKLWEIIYDFKDILDINKLNICQLKTAHIAEGPGGFIECIYKYIHDHLNNNINLNNLEIYGITLFSNSNNIPKWKIKKNMIDRFNINLNKKEDGNGDLYSIDNINKFIYNVGESSCEFITADGGFDFSCNYNTQESDFLLFLISEIYIILKLLKNNGNCLIKVYDIYSKISIKILYILTLFFKDVYIIKPYTSRPANSEKYILCKNFNNLNELDDNIISYIEMFKKIIINKDLNILHDNNIVPPYDLVEDILNYNKWYTERQINYINKTIDLIEYFNNNPNENEKDYLKKLYNHNKKYCLNWCLNYNIFCKK